MVMGTIAEVIATWLQSSAPCVTSASAGPIRSHKPFDEIEATAVMRALKKRQDEFHTGRRLARVALERLGCAPVPIGVANDRAPLWPPGFVGSISHTASICLAHVARACDLVGIGVDIEPIAPMPFNVARLICCPDEECAATEHAGLLHFVAKEAFFKAYYPASCSFLDFHDVRVELDRADSIVIATIVADEKPLLCGRRAFKGRFAEVGDHYVAAFWAEP